MGTATMMKLHVLEMDFDPDGRNGTTLHLGDAEAVVINSTRPCILEFEVKTGHLIFGKHRLELKKGPNGPYPVLKHGQNECREGGRLKPAPTPQVIESP